MIDRAVYGDRMNATERSAKDDAIYVPKLAYSFVTHSKVLFFHKKSTYF